MVRSLTVPLQLAAPKAGEYRAFVQAACACKEDERSVSFKITFNVPTAESTI